MAGVIADIICGLALVVVILLLVSYTGELDRNNKEEITKDCVQEGDIFYCSKDNVTYKPFVAIKVNETDYELRRVKG